MQIAVSPRRAYFLRFSAILTLFVCPLLRAADRVEAKLRADLVSLVDSEIANEMSGWINFYKHLHSHPELSLAEEESARHVAEQLKAAGFAVTTGVGGHGVVGVLANGDGPTVLIRGDMDALPIKEETDLPYRSSVTVVGKDGIVLGVMHACGHDIHQTCLIGTAHMLGHLKDKWRGTVVAVAQPAEEIGKGARMMIEDGFSEQFPRPNYCIALHVASDQPAGEIGYTPGWALANVDSVDITIYGRGGHGSRPNETVDPVVTAAQVIVSLQTIVSRRVDPIEPAVITVGSIHAGAKHNIIPNEATMLITVRSYTEETRRILLDGIREVTVNTCRAMGCERDPKVEFREDEFTPATYNDPNLTETSAELLRRALGPAKVREVRARMGGEDFGQFGKHLNVPSFMFWLGSVHRDRYDASRQKGAEPLPSLHSSKYYPDPDPTIRTGVKCLTSLTLGLLNVESR